MKGFPTSEQIERLRSLYPKGTVICCDGMYDDPRPIPRGTIGEVLGVDDAGQIMVKWNNGSSLSLVPGVDSYHIVQPTEDMEQEEEPEIEDSQGMSIDL